MPQCPGCTCGPDAKRARTALLDDDQIALLQAMAKTLVDASDEHWQTRISSTLRVEAKHAAVETATETADKLCERALADTKILLQELENKWETKFQKTVSEMLSTSAAAPSDGSTFGADGGRVGCIGYRSRRACF